MPNWVVPPSVPDIGWRSSVTGRRQPMAILRIRLHDVVMALVLVSAALHGDLGLPNVWSSAPRMLAASKPENWAAVGIARDLLLSLFGFWWIHRKPRPSMDEYSPYSKGQLSLELAAAALSMHSMPMSSYHTLAGLDAFTPASYHGTASQPINAYPPPHYQYPHDQHDSFMPSALSGSNLALHDALTNAFLSAQLQQQRPPSPQMHYPLRWPEADSYPQYPMANTSDPALAQGPSLFPSSYSVAPQSTYQSVQDAQSAASQPAWSVSGSLDPVTGVFQRMAEHPRLRTAQACEKCRARKAKCSGEHPSCQRCRSRGLLCEYAPERRMRGPNKKKREGSSVERLSPPAPDDGRRGSIVSVASTSSATSDLDNYRFPEIPAAVQASIAAPRPDSRASLPHLNVPHPPSPMRQSNRSHDFSGGIPSSPLRFPMDGGASSMSPPPPPVQTSMQGRRRPRPPPLRLGDAALFNSSAFLQHMPLTPDPVPRSAAELVDDATPTYAARRQSLPSYLVHEYTPTPPVLTERFSQLSDHSHSRSTSNSEAPLTPLSVPESKLSPHGDLAYPDDFVRGFEGRLGGIQEGREPFEPELPPLDANSDTRMDGKHSVGVTVVDVSPVEARIVAKAPEGET
ncbi:uncharacterized protein B0H18DRAFT_1209003 [Fomitopsis serialis]|uniref:uncharacterized protein n=1 Tax=Fomitopsis serialis TaxID=139415 RepID=UPI0020079FC8|nr:uncharacterized protein B0H18DRAFT_1209003 [Neoantrodia serialis]KAH9931328.1 hypothetical protein B0H18DRAFT_1209003 [Neoantrodia serialis]